MTQIAKFTADELNIWRSTNCVDDHITIAEDESGQFCASNKHGSTVGVCYNLDKLIRQLECDFSWSVTI